MANINLVTWSQHLVTPQDDALVYEVAVGGDGIIYGAEITLKNSNTLHITAGHGILCGRKFTIDDGDIPIVLPSSGTLQGRLYIHMDLSNASEPIALLTETGQSLTPVVQDADVNIIFGVYEINLCTFEVSETAISGLEVLTPMVAPNKQTIAENKAAAQRAVNALDHTATITLPVTAWSLDNMTYRQSVTIPKASVFTDNPVFDLHVSSPPPTEEQLADYERLIYIHATESSSNVTFTFYASSTPDAAVMISASGINGTYTGA